MRVFKIGVVVVFVALVLGVSGAGATEAVQANVPQSSCLFSEGKATSPASHDLSALEAQANPSYKPQCWEILCFSYWDCQVPGDCNGPAYCDFQFGGYGFCAEY